MMEGKGENMTNLKMFVKNHKIQVHLTPTIMILAIIFLSLSPNSTSHAYIAEFTVKGLYGIANVDDSEPLGIGDPDCYFVMGIFESDFSNRTYEVHYNNSTWEGTGTWDFPDITISREFDQQPIYFYFALIDDDPADTHDLLGDHWFQATSDYSGPPVWNNNDAPFHPAYLGINTEYDGWENNFALSYEAVVTPIPGAVWLLGSGLLGMIGLRRKGKK
jgi:hypothetical protein